MPPYGLVRFLNGLNPTSHGRNWLASKVAMRSPMPRGVFSIGRGTRMMLDCADETERAIYLGCFETLVRRSLLKWLRRGMHVVDVGANIGYYTLLSHSAVQSGGKISAFEPNPIIFPRLEENVRLNGAAEVERFQCALSNTNGEVSLYSPIDETHGLTSMREQGWAQSRRSTVPARRLDDVLADAHVDVLKIDVEGAEKLVLEGACHMIRTSKPKMVVELNPTAAAAFGYDTIETVRFILDCHPGYTVRKVHAHHLEVVDFASMESAGSPDGNFLFEP